MKFTPGIAVNMALLAAVLILMLYAPQGVLK